MSTQNFFALLGDDENEDPIAAIERATSPAVAAASAAATKKQPVQPAAAAKLPSKPLPPAEAVKEGRGYENNNNNTNNYNTRGGRGGRGVRGGARGGYADREGGGFRDRDSGFSRDFVPRDRPNYGGDRNSNYTRNGGEPTEGGYQGGRGGGGYYGGGDRAPRGEDGEVRSYDGSRGRGRGRGRDRGFGGVDGEERPRRREFDRHSGSGRGTELKRDGAGRGNWGTDGDQVSVFTEPIEPVKDEKSPAEVEDKKVEPDFSLPESAAAVVVEDGEEKKEEEEDNEMTLDEYEKILEEKKKALDALKAEERKVKVDKDFETMQLVEKKNDEDFFIKLGSEKDKGKKKEVGEKEEKAKKAVSINEFLKPADGERYYGAGGRGRGRGRGRGEDRGGFRGGFAGNFNNARRGSAPRIEDPAQFPTLGGK